MKILGSGDESDTHGGEGSSPVPLSAPVHTHQPDWSLAPVSTLGTSAGASASASSQPHLHHQQHKSNIREKLRKFFLRRPTMDDLFRRGIIRNEPVFGSTLRELQQAEMLQMHHQQQVLYTASVSFKTKMQHFFYLYSISVCPAPNRVGPLVCFALRVRDRT